MVKEFAVIQDMPYPPQGWQYNEYSMDKAYIDPEIIISSTILKLECPCRTIKMTSGD